MISTILRVRNTCKCPSEAAQTCLAQSHFKSSSVWKHHFRKRRVWRLVLLSLSVWTIFGGFYAGLHHCTEKWPRDTNRWSLGFLVNSPFSWNLRPKWSGVSGDEMSWHDKGRSSQRWPAKSLCSASPETPPLPGITLKLFPCPPACHHPYACKPYSAAVTSCARADHVSLGQKTSWPCPSHPTAVLSSVWICRARAPTTACVYATCSNKSPLWCA